MSDYVAKQGTTAMSVIGTALGGLATIGGLGGMLGLGSGEKDYFTKSEAQLMYDNTAKDSKISLLEANAATDAKLVEVYKAASERDAVIRAEINNEFKNIRNEMRDAEDKQTAINAAQAVDNANTASSIAVLGTNQAGIQALLNNLTKTVIPNANVCPGFMPLPTVQSQCYCGTVTSGTTIA